MSKKLVIVESPTKARTIRKFLDNEYTVESCMGHIRDLPQSARDIPEKYKKESWSNLGVNVDKNFSPIYCVPKNKTKVVRELKQKLKDVDELILATDEDREGESISWHLLEVLKPKVPVKRIVFHEITKTAIHNALKEFRQIDDNLVRAQEARRILDRLVGYTISPVLWKKVAYGLSAGRVQSVAVRLIAQKEHERIRFKKSDYWSLQSENKKSGRNFKSRLVSYQDQKVATGKDFSGESGKLKEDLKTTIVLDQQLAEKIKKEAQAAEWKVTSVVEKPLSRNPSPPFITSTLQQEANRKLKLSSRETMSVAQKLYEKGFITYMRTDSTSLSQEAIKAARSEVKKLYGQEYLPDEPRTYTKKKVKGAQEAHEAIRPAGEKFQLPESTNLKNKELELYDLIWKRTMASQMKNSQHKQMQVRIAAGDLMFAASGMTTEFPGFLKAYVEGHDDPEAALSDKEVHLPSLKEGDNIEVVGLEAAEHETKPPARYTEASLVQVLEKEGIGRPSTYASIISTIQTRGYVEKKGSALVPTFTALIVSKLLCEHFPNYVDEGFTSQVESCLDDIAQGGKEWVDYLKKIYFGDKQVKDDAGLKAQVERGEEQIDPGESRSIALEGLEEFSFRVGRYGAYVCRPDEEGSEICVSIPIQYTPGDITKDEAEKLILQKIHGFDSLGDDPETGLPVYALTGRYGPYVQLGDSEAEKTKPKRTSIPKNMSIDTITLEEALQLLSLPKTLGTHPDLEKDIKVGLGRFGPYVVCDGDFRSIPAAESLFDVNLTRALELLAQPKGRGRAAPLKTLGKHPVAKDEITVHTGKYGPYVKCGKVNASFSDDIEPKDMTLEKAVELLESKISQSSKKKAKKKKTAKKAASKKKVTKKKTKTATKKKAKKKTKKKS